MNHLDRKALHEAGHVCTALAGGGSITFAHVDADSGYVDAMTSYGDACAYASQVAGVIAERLDHLDAPWSDEMTHGQLDMSRARAKNLKRADALRVCRDVARTLTRDSRRVRAVAEQLVARGRLDDAEVRAIGNRTPAVDITPAMDAQLAAADWTPILDATCGPEPERADAAPRVQRIDMDPTCIVRWPDEPDHKPVPRGKRRKKIA